MTAPDGSVKKRGKKRGTHGKEPRSYRVVDGPDDALELVESDVSEDAKVAELADELVEIILERAPLSTSDLRDAAKERGAGTQLTTDALTFLRAEEPRRVSVGWEVIETPGGRQRAKAWRPVEDVPEPTEELF
jgi:hypothetical protein